MTILHISDTHGIHRRLKDLPDADVLVHSGDFTMNGSEAEAIDFLNWLCALRYKHKIFICGNHDECMYEANIEGLDENVHYLCNSSIEIEGLKFYGIPMFMRDVMLRKQNSFYEMIPSHTDVLITHCPPYGILDFDDNKNWGAEDLLISVIQQFPKIHLFGHIHRSHGIIKMGSTIYSNAAIMNENYKNPQTPNLVTLT